MTTSVWVRVSNVSRVQKGPHGRMVSKTKWVKEGAVATVVPCSDIPSTEPAPLSWNPLQHLHLPIMPLRFSQQMNEHGRNAPTANSDRGLPAHHILSWYLFLWGLALTQRVSTHCCQKLLRRNKEVWKTLQNG